LLHLLYPRLLPTHTSSFLLLLLLLLLLTLQAGSKVVCVADGLPTWVCELMVVKPTVQEAIDFVTSIDASLDIPIDPLP
jgi:hypothetical protein